MLRPGGFGRIRIETGVDKGALLVPQAAVTQVQSMYLLAVVTPDNKAVFRPVKPGERVGTNWIISEGLKPGERVVVDGLLKLQMLRPRRRSWPRPAFPWSRNLTSSHHPGGRGQLTMPKFFINRPIVAMCISILMVLVGVVSMLSLPTAQFPNIADPQIQVLATYPGADAQTVAESVATPIEQQMSGVSGMNYMYSTSASNGLMTLTVDFALGTNANTDQILAQMRQGQANSQLPSAVINSGVTVQQSTSSPLMLIALSSRTGLTTIFFWLTTPSSI